MERLRLATDDEVEAALNDLHRQAHKVRAAEWPGVLTGLDAPGLYSWWVDHAGARDLTTGLGPLHADLVYAGQTGATKWPSGTTGSATLRSRIGGNHVRGRVRSSTFRLTLAAALRKALKLVVVGPKLLAPASEQALSAWIVEHLQVAVHSFPNADALADLEHRVLARLEPPLNLDGMHSTPLRSGLKGLRAELSTGTPMLAIAPAARRQAGAARTRAGRLPNQPTLHDELQAILADASTTWMTTAELAECVNERGNYRKRDGSAVTAFQVARRSYHHPELFVIDGSRVKLSGQSS